MRECLRLLRSFISSGRPSPQSRISRSVRSRDTLAVPDRPGCSRWLSCSCRLLAVHDLQRRIDFFSAREPAATRSVIPQQHIGSPSYDEPPLPPGLPYSPNSVPFQRQVQALSYALHKRSADPSWDVINSIHPELRAHIPGHLLSALLDRQLTVEDVDIRWRRSLFVHGDILPPESVGIQTIIMLIRTGLESIVKVPVGAIAYKEDFSAICRYWELLQELVNGEYTRIPLEVRASWLQEHIRQMKGAASSYRRRLFVAQRACVAVRDMLRSTGGIAGLEELATEILKPLEVPFRDQIQRLARMVECWEYGLPLEDEHVIEVIRLIDLALARSAVSGGNDAVKPSSSSTISELKDAICSVETGTMDSQSRLFNCLDQYLRRNDHGDAFEKARNLIAETKPSMELTDSSSRRLLQRSSRRSDPAITLDLAVKLLGQMLRRRHVSPQPTIRKLCRALYSYAIGTSKDPQMTPDVVDRLIHQLLLEVVLSDYIVRLDANIYPRLLRLWASSCSEQPTGLAKRLYLTARSVTPPLVWTAETRSTWRKLFTRAVSSRAPQVSFASRLYADLLSDGLVIGPDEAIAMVRLAGSTTGPTQSTLLARHISDFHLLGLSRQHRFIDAMIEGLTSSGDPEVSLTAAKRVLDLVGTQSIPIRSAQLLIHSLTRFPRSDHLQQSLKVLRRLPHGDERNSRFYDAVLRSLLETPVTDAKEGSLSAKEQLQHAIALYKDMGEQGLEPTSETASSFIRGLLRAGFDDSALSVFASCMDVGLWPQRSAVDRLRGVLDRKKRFQDSDMVTARWREAVGPESPPSDDKPTRLVHAPRQKMPQPRVDVNDAKVFASDLAGAQNVQHIPPMSHDIPTSLASPPSQEPGTKWRIHSVTEISTNTAEQANMEPRREERRKGEHKTGREDRTETDTEERTEDGLTGEKAVIRSAVTPST